MDPTKLSKLLRLMKLLTGNVSRTIDQFAKGMGAVYRYIYTIRDTGFIVNNGIILPWKTAAKSFPKNK